jgi:hypothetical protein
MASFLMPTEKLLFIDTNIWLDFYRARKDAGLKLLRNVEALSDKLIVTYQLESEFKRNRQNVLNVLMDSWGSLKAPNDLGFPNIVADAKASKMLTKYTKEARARVARVKKLIVKAMLTPRHDPVYQACERIFRRKDELVLDRSNVLRKRIRNKALRRFLQGYPPRKRNDTSIGDAFNWEWMVHCAAERRAELVIITRDSDFGVTIDKKSYPNDHLKQEFKERVSSRRKVVIFDHLVDGLKYFKVNIPKNAAKEWLRAEYSGSTLGDFNEWLGQVSRAASARPRMRSGALLLPSPELPPEGDGELDET